MDFLIFLRIVNEFEQFTLVIIYLKVYYIYEEIDEKQNKDKLIKTIHFVVFVLFLC